MKDEKIFQRISTIFKGSGSLMILYPVLVGAYPRARPPEARRPRRDRQGPHHAVSRPAPRTSNSDYRASAQNAGPPMPRPRDTRHRRHESQILSRLPTTQPRPTETRLPVPFYLLRISPVLPRPAETRQHLKFYLLPSRITRPRPAPLHPTAINPTLTWPSRDTCRAYFLAAFGTRPLGAARLRGLGVARLR